MPREVLRVGAGEAEVAEVGGDGRLTVSLALLSEPVAAGDYLVLQARRYAVEVMDAAEAQVRLELFAELGLVGGAEEAQA